MATTAVTLDGFPLIGTTPGGGRVVGFKMGGWLSGSNDRARSKRTGGQGSWSTKATRAQKSITVTGMVRYASTAAAATERRAMLAVGGLGGVPLIVTDSLDAIGMTVEVDDADIPPVMDSLLTFTYDLVASDPLARSTTATTVTVAAGATVSHTAAGTFAAEIEVTTTSSGTVDLTIGGLRLRWGSLPSGSVLTSGPGFTNRPRTVLGPTGANLFGLIVQPMQWPAISPGANSLVNAGTADLSVRYFPTYA